MAKDLRLGKRQEKDKPGRGREKGRKEIKQVEVKATTGRGRVKNTGKDKRGACSIACVLLF